MQHVEPFLSAIWREVSRHTQIVELTERLHSMLAQRLPVAVTLIRRLDQGRARMETVAAAGVATGGGVFESRMLDPGSDVGGLLEWAARGRVRRWSPTLSPAPELSMVVPPGLKEPALIGPLCDTGPAAAFLVLAAAAPGGFTATHESVAQSLLEPFSAALANDQRLRELCALREAAEEDKRSLLRRMGRKELVETVVGADNGLLAVMERVDLVARSNVPVLIIGETGTGKEVIARAIHTRSPRSSGPFIRVNCGAIPHELIDSQLFGHERGAFTGAVESREGWFERADGGTLFLDEIGELPPAAQVRLLRILQDGWLERVGGRKPIHVDVRIVAATHRDLPRMVADQTFRDDLWYRIAVFPILLPPLRDRPQDISALATHFARRAATRFGLPTALPTAADIALLESYTWPGNIRELGAVIDRAAILGDGQRLEIPKALGIGSAAAVPAPPPAPAAAVAGVPSAAIFALDQAMKQHIEAALRLTHGRVEGPHGAAGLLNINPNTLRGRMRKLGIQRKPFAPDAESHRRQCSHRLPSPWAL